MGETLVHERKTSRQAASAATGAAGEPQSVVASAGSRARHTTSAPSSAARRELGVEEVHALRCKTVCSRGWRHPPGGQGWGAPESRCRARRGAGRSARRRWRTPARRSADALVLKPRESVPTGARQHRLAEWRVELEGSSGDGE